MKKTGRIVVTLLILTSIVNAQTFDSGLASELQYKIDSIRTSDNLKGISASMDILVDDSSLIRLQASDTQTKKSRFARYENLQDAFEVKNPTELEGKHILLVDDVITTGATLEACIVTLQEKAKVQLSVCALAFAE